MLPFYGGLVEHAVNPLPVHWTLCPPSLSRDEYLKWFESDSVLPHVKQWKGLVLDPPEVRRQWKKGLDVKPTEMDTLVKSLQTMSFLALQRSGPSTNDTWEATAFFAAKLVLNNDQKGSPIHGMLRLGQVHWCYEVMILLLICVFCDVEENKEGYWTRLLSDQCGNSGGEPEAQIRPLRHEQANTHRLRTIES